MIRSILISTALFIALLSREHMVAQEQPVADAAVAAWVDDQLPDLAQTYTWFHTHPELSFEEDATADKFAQSLTQSGFEVTTNVGGYGVVGVLKNGVGKTLLLRADLDALPVTEDTGLPFASQVTTTLDDGSTTGVMHACGHDFHLTNMVAVSRYLANNRSLWHGTLVVIGQPAEERGAGARAMLNDDLLSRFPTPDFAVALHTAEDVPAHSISLVAGPAFANVDSVDIFVKGRGGHGSAPHTTVDPIVQAAELVLSLQTIVSREIAPSEPAVVTIGAIRGGTKHNIIGDECHLQLTVRSYTPEVREKILVAIKRKSHAIAKAYDAPEPQIQFSEGTPSLSNDEELVGRLRLVFERVLGKDRVKQDLPRMGGEDFSQFGLAGIPILMYRVGTVTPERLQRYEEQGIPVPSLHSSRYYPDFEPALKTATTTMVAAAIDLLQ